MGNVPDMAALLDEYYTARGWDQVSGLPTRQKMIELGLEFTCV
jgi:aldehyde:ferredoxin oxidoreductase